MRVGLSVLLILVFFVFFGANIAAVDAQPSVEIYTDRDTYVSGDRIEVSLSGGNDGEGTSVAVYIGLLTPDARIYALGPTGWSDWLQPWIADGYLTNGFRFLQTPVWSFDLPCSMPPISAEGQYNFAAVLTRPGTSDWVSDLSLAPFWFGESSDFRGGSVTSDTTIGGRLDLIGNVVIYGEAVLTIRPGSRVRLGKDIAIHVFGGLIAEGDRPGSIAFERLQPDDAWGNITFWQTAIDEKCRLVNCRIQGAGGFHDERDRWPGAIYCYESSPWIEANTITGNSARYRGGAIYCYNSSPTITNNVITGNSAGFWYDEDWYGCYGGGIYSEESSPTITKNVISDNTAGLGGAILCSGGSPIITGNTIAGNSAGSAFGEFAGEGGGIKCSGGSPIITGNTIADNCADWGGGIECRTWGLAAISGNTISDNSADSCGGGIYCSGSLWHISDNRIIGNSAGYDGGGIYCDGGSWTEGSWLTMDNNTITDNSAQDHGGAIYCGDNSSPTISNSTISRNSAGEGGGICCYDHSSPTITNNTISDNAADSYGGGLYCRWYGSPAVKSNTITGNSADAGGGIYCAAISLPTIVDCILWANGDDLEGCSATYCCIEDLDEGEGNIHDDPMFVPGPLGCYYLDPQSPCIDAGSGSAEEAGLSDRTTQADGTPDTGQVDMGYHYPSTDVESVFPLLSGSDLPSEDGG